MNRRTFLKGAAFIGINTVPVASILATPSLANTSTEKHWLYSAATHQHKHYLSAINLSHDTVRLVELAERAHQVLESPTGSAIVAISRRPGTTLTIIDSDTFKKITDIRCIPNTHFYGHACYSSDGRYLFTSEQNYLTGEGLIGIRDTQSAYRLIRHISSHGVGPHELKLDTKNQILVVANGGIRTQPKFGRKKLNIDSMQSNLAYINPYTGKLMDHQFLPPSYQKSSIRHLDINNQGKVVVATQHQGDPSFSISLAAISGLHQMLEIIPFSEELAWKKKHYVGSIKFDKSGRYLAMSSPRGNLISFWDAETKALLNTAHINDGCGIQSIEQREFVLSSGLGRIYRYGFDTEQKVFVRRNKLNIGFNKGLLSFDNHLGQ